MMNREWDEGMDCSRHDKAAEEVAQLLRALPNLPAPASRVIPTRPRGWLQPVTIIWLLLLPLTAYLLQQILMPSLVEAALQVTPYPHWQELLNDAQYAMQTGLQWVQEVLG